MKVKYPKTMHLPWSRSYTDDDKILRNTDHFAGREVVITEKMDGENTTMYRDFMHARSLDSKDHTSRHYVKTHQISDPGRIPVMRGKRVRKALAVLHGSARLLPALLGMG